LQQLQIGRRIGRFGNFRTEGEEAEHLAAPRNRHEQLCLELAEHVGFGILYLLRPGTRLIEIDRKRFSRHPKLLDRISVPHECISRKFGETENGSRAIVILIVEKDRQLSDVQGVRQPARYGF